VHSLQLPSAASLINAGLSNGVGSHERPSRDSFSNGSNASGQSSGGTGTNAGSIMSLSNLITQQSNDIDRGMLGKLERRKQG
jgi:hypothetical protein